MLEDKKIFHFSKEDVDKKVFHTFLSNSGISEDKPDYLSKIERLEKTAIRYKQFADPLVDVRAVVAKADFSINGEKIIIGGKNYGRIIFEFSNHKFQYHNPYAPCLYQIPFPSLVLSVFPVLSFQGRL